MEREKEIYRVTVLGAVVNVLLTAFKFVAGVISGSAAMMADAVHSLSDFLTDIVLVVFVRLGSKPKDDDHEYGHGKYETLASAIIGLSLLAVGLSLCWKSGKSIVSAASGARLETPGILALAAALVSILAKELVYRVTERVGKQTNSPAVVANAWHHRSDALSSIGAAAGISGALFLGPKWAVLDPIAALIVSAMILWTASNLVLEACSDLLEKSLPKEVEDLILRIAESEPQVSAIHNLRTRRIGSHYAIEMHIRMPGDISLSEAHVHASSIERRLREQFGEETHVNIHAEPLK